PDRVLGWRRLLRLDELLDVRVVDPHDAHLRSAAMAAAGRAQAHLVEYPHEVHGAARERRELDDHIAARPERAEVVPDAAAHAHGPGRGLGDVHDGIFPGDERVL